MRGLIAAAVCGLLLMSLSCKPAETTATKPQVTQPKNQPSQKILPPQAAQPPVQQASPTPQPQPAEQRVAPPQPEMGKELSKAPGVSIRRVPEDKYRPRGEVLSTDGFQAENDPLFTILSFLCPGNLTLCDEDALAQGCYDVSLKAESKEDAWKKLVEALQKSFPVQIAHEKRELDVYVLKCPRDAAGAPVAPATLKPTQADQCKQFTDEKGGWTFVCTTMEEFADVLRQYMNEFVLDETGLKGKYDFSTPLFWQQEAAKSVAAVRHLGLNLVKAKRPVEGYFIEKAPSTAPAETKKP